MSALLVSEVSTCRDEWRTIALTVFVAMRICSLVSPGAVSGRMVGILVSDNATTQELRSRVSI
jgi:hypothetical protein